MRYFWFANESITFSVSISWSNSCSITSTDIADNLSCPIVDRCQFLTLFKIENDLSPSHKVPKIYKYILKAMLTYGKLVTILVFICLIIISLTDIPVFRKLLNIKNSLTIQIGFIGFN